MAFVRQKKSDSVRGYSLVYHLVENRRVDGKIRQKVLAYLGSASTPETALWNVVQDLRWQLRKEAYLETKQKAGPLTMSDQLALARAERKIGRLLMRIELLKQYAAGPEPDPQYEFDVEMDPDIQRTWNSLKISHQGGMLRVWCDL